MFTINRRHLLAAVPTLAVARLLPGRYPTEAAGLPASRRARRTALFAARNWVSFYQSPAPPARRTALKAFDYLDIDADEGNFDSRAHARAVVGDLRKERRLVVSYLNIGAAETFRWYWRHAEPFKLDPYSGWPGEFWMDVREPGWRRVVVDRVAPVLADAGVDGFYLDNIDVSSRYDTPAFRAGVVEMVRELRAAFPEHLLIGQSYDMAPYLDRGSDGRRMFEYLDGTSKEEVNGTYQGGYQRVPRAESDRMLAELRAFRRRGLHVTVLDYANRRPDAAYCIRRTTESGLLPFVSVHDLDSTRIWDTERRPGTPRDVVAIVETMGGREAIELTWASGGDDMGVSRFDVQRGGRIIGYAAVPRFVDLDAPAGELEYRVRAWDTGRHASGWSAPVVITNAARTGAPRGILRA